MSKKQKFNNDENAKLARYNAKLSISWNDLRTKNLKNEQ
jgi:hypothetical protein